MCEIVSGTQTGHIVKSVHTVKSADESAADPDVSISYEKQVVFLTLEGRKHKNYSP